jgi:hypothetical protein
VPVLTRAEAGTYLSCNSEEREQGQPCADGDPDLLEPAPSSAGEIANADGSASIECLAGDVAVATQSNLLGDSSGHLYGANILEEWTQDVTRELPDLEPDERAVEVYWNVSTWNPYQVVMVKTQLRARVGATSPR